MSISRLWRVAFVFVLVMLAGCVTAPEKTDDNADRLAVGTVQKEIRIGMTGGEVAAVLGSPNIVTTDEQRREVWIYDKISQEITANRSGGYGTLILFGGSSESASASRSSKTLTVIIKFDNEGRVRDFAYHTSRF